MRYFTLLILATVLLFSGCSKDTQDIQEDLCKGIICNNGGNCVNGSCNCPQEYTGSDCSQQKTPSNITITSINVTRFPGTKSNGGSWDTFPNSGPDIYIVIIQNGVEVFTSAHYENALATQTYNFIVNKNIKPNEPAIVRLFDLDTFGSDEFMGGVEFQPYHNTNNFPSSLDVDAGFDVAFDVKIDYLF